MKFLKAAIVIITAAAALSAAALFYMDTPADPRGGASPFTVNQGESAAEIAAALERAGMIRSRWYFMLLARSGGRGGDLKAGTFDVSPAMTTRAILDFLATSPGKPKGFKVTIPEGFTARQVADRLESAGVCRSEEFMDLVDDPADAGIDLHGADAASLEGLLFPETYYLDENSGCENTARRMVDQFFKVFTKDYMDRAAEIGLTVNEAVTLASLVEKEARVNGERARISGVLHNRLKAGMLLQCDATIQYVLPEHREKLYYKDLEVDSPYNTYLVKGLPPGPICNPGEDSLYAALYPEETKYYYYVARPDGTHIFSRSNDEHIRAKQQAKREARAAKQNNGR